MTYDELAKQAEQLSYRDKLRLAQLMIQAGRKEEEELHPATRKAAVASGPLDPELIEYVSTRLRKLRPSNKETLFNSIKAMFQFQGGISESDRERILLELIKERHIRILEKDRVEYPDQR